ncbi:hypothetical protein [Polyangium jinanense]|uniref:Uncharacterized protein n=1 Tax=Polyangium jinanense TaxID=2829994 RepID=A0A9X3X9S7_9BACT|nr:hypothetical protein [Polyangium jinanense]MDC3955994.1 hypothetical protein [Polyangium jinanense]MDC3961499.1 hypothetical protein [Polyangium jinanense]MDC3986354.1 hypothetical protein [Polyangium jinanense]
MSIASLLLAAAACGPAESEDESVDVEQALDALDVSQHEAALVVASIARLDPKSAYPDLAAVKAAATAGLVFRPTDCVTATRKDNTVKYLLSGCIGPFKTANLDGTFDVVFSVGASGLHALASARDLHASRAILDIDSEGFYSLDADGETRRLVVEASGEGVGPRGHRIERAGSYTVTWNATEKCVTFDGDWETIVGARAFHTVVSGLARCAGECPAAGGEIVHEKKALDIHIRITFDGSARATWSSSRGQSGTIPLFCGAGS